MATNDDELKFVTANHEEGVNFKSFETSKKKEDLCENSSFSLLRKMAQAKNDLVQSSDLSNSTVIRDSNSLRDIANDSLSDFHIQINEKLNLLGFGVAQIEDLNTALQITHRQIEECTDQSFADSWQRAFAVVLCGLYQGYFAQAGAPSALVCKVVSIVAPNEVVLQLKKRG